MNQPLFFFLAALLPIVPLLGVSIAGILLSRSKLKRSHSRARTFATIGFTLLALHALVGPGIRTHAALYAAQTGDKVAYAGGLTIANSIGYLLLLAALAFCLLAILADRGSSESPNGAA